MAFGTAVAAFAMTAVAGMAMGHPVNSLNSTLPAYTGLNVVAATMNSTNALTSPYFCGVQGVDMHAYDNDSTFSMASSRDQGQWATIPTHVHMFYRSEDIINDQGWVDPKV